MRRLHPFQELPPIGLLLLITMPVLAQNLPSMNRVGITGAGVELKLSEAIRMAIENNPTLKVSDEEVNSRGFSLVSRRGVFDPRFQLDTRVDSEKLPVGSILAGSEAGELDTSLFTNRASLSQDLPFGGNWSVLVDASRASTSSQFVLLDPQFPTFLGVNLVLPLIQNRKIDSQRLEIEIALQDLDAAEADLRQIALDLVTQVRVRYWQLVLARETERVRAEAYRLATDQMESNRRLLGAGQASAADVVEAEAAQQRRLDDWLISVERITARENDLKGLILGSRSGALWNRELILMDTQETGTSAMSVSEAWEKAARGRPEFERLGALERAQKANSGFLENQTRPRLDLFASYGLNGLAGSVRSGDNPLTSQNDAFRERTNELSEFHALNPVPIPPSGSVPERLVGGLGQSFSNLFSGDFRSGSIGLTLEIPIKNQEAKAELAGSRVRERQLELERRGLEQRIEGEIRSALQAVDTNRQRVEAASAATAASLSRLESEQRLFRAGETTTFLVLVRQAVFVDNSGNEAAAKADLNIALAKLQRVVGNALETFGIQLRNGTQP